MSPSNEFGQPNRQLWLQLSAVPAVEVDVGGDVLEALANAAANEDALE